MKSVILVIILVPLFVFETKAQSSVTSPTELRVPYELFQGDFAKYGKVKSIRSTTFQMIDEAVDTLQLINICVDNFDVKGRLINQKVLDRDNSNKVDFSLTIHFKGELLDSVSGDQNAKMRYNQLVQLSKVTHFNKNSKGRSQVLEYQIYEYNDDGRLKKIKAFDKDHKNYQNQWIHHDKNGIFEGYKLVDEDTMYWIQQKLSRDVGQSILINKNSNGDTTHYNRTVLTTDEDGNRIALSVFNQHDEEILHETFTYIFDHCHNAIEVKTFRNGKLVGKKINKIEYYENLKK